MSDAYIRKNGLIYTEDSQVIVGIDTAASEFTGKIPYGAKEIRDEAFADCPFQSVTLPDSLKELPPCLFENASALEEVKLPPSIPSLPPYLFSGCAKLRKVTLPDVLVSVPEGLFYGCASLPEIPFRAGIQEIPENFAALCSSVKSLVIPDAVTTIGSRAFADCKSLESVVLPAKLYSLADDAFEGCENLHTIRIDESNRLYYIKDFDLCLYERSLDGDDVLKLSVNGSRNDGVGFFKENVDDEPLEPSDDEDFEEDDTFSAEIGAEEFDGETEEQTMQVVRPAENIITEDNKEFAMSDAMNNDVDDLAADILGAEKAKNDALTQNIAITEQEAAVLSESLDAMQDATMNKGEQLSMDELANLSEANENAENAKNEKAKTNEIEDEEKLDPKTQTLVDSVEFSKIYYHDPNGESPADADLFVIAERIIEFGEGKKTFSQKLEDCCNSFGRIQDFKRVFLLYGLPLDNDEFRQFYHHFINKRNVILACTASSPSTLSEYGRRVCEESRISLDKAELAAQRQKIRIKNDTLIKLVIQDV